MSKYVVKVDVSDVNGYQCFLVDANSEDEAIQKWKADGGEFFSEEVEVYDLDHSSCEAQPFEGSEYDSDLRLLAKEFDEAPADAEWHEGHPIFNLAQENDNYRARINQLEQRLAKAERDVRRMDWIEKRVVEGGRRGHITIPAYIKIKDKDCEWCVRGEMDGSCSCEYKSVGIRKVIDAAINGASNASK